MTIGTAVSGAVADGTACPRKTQPLNVVAFNWCSRQYAAYVSPDLRQVLTCCTQSARFNTDLILDILTLQSGQAGRVREINWLS